MTVKKQANFLSQSENCHFLNYPQTKTCHSPVCGDAEVLISHQGPDVTYSSVPTTKTLINKCINLTECMISALITARSKPDQLTVHVFCVIL